MVYLSGKEKEEALKFMGEAVIVAKNATCKRAKCGFVIVKEGLIIGKGFNSPPFGLEEQRKCENNKENYDRKVSDKTCCIHAEQRAVIDALRNYPGQVEGSVLYFIRLDEEGGKSFSGKPYCTHCSKLALDVGVKSFVLYHEEGVCAYDTKEYNLISYQYQT